MKQTFILILACICMLACRQQPQKAVVDVEHYDLPQMKDSGVLVALTLNSSISYFDYRGEPMGYQYELAKQFAQSLGLKLEMKTAKSTHELVEMLLRGEGDVIAYPLPVTKAFKDTVAFCGEDIVTHQVLVQRNSTKDKKALTNVTDLLEKGYIPVISTIGCDKDGNTYNINGDTAAAYIAGAMNAEKLFMMTDIDGILRDKDDPSTIIPHLTVSEAKQLYTEGIVSGGMIPKVDCCIEAIHKGVKNVTIMDGRVPHSILMELLTDEGAGTMVVGD